MTRENPLGGGKQSEKDKKVKREMETLASQESATVGKIGRVQRPSEILY